MAKYNRLNYGGKTYDRAALPALLTERIKAVRSDDAHPFNDSKHPQHDAAVADMDAAYR
jgi:hypothetical protein